MKTVNIRNRDMYWDIAADIHFPPNFEKTKKYPAIISAHPIGSCKEQTSGNVYGAALPEPVRQALDKLVPFFKTHLNGAAAASRPQAAE